MPDRIIKESICTSETLDKLTWFEEVFWHRLTVTCDDFGRFDARPAILKSRLFPLKTKVTDKMIADALERLSEIDLIFIYEVDERSYLQIVTWSKYQRTRADKSKFPSPNDSRGHLTADSRECQQVTASESADICGHLTADSRECPRNTISESDKRYTISDKRESDFEEFWSSYPKKVGKESAKKSFAKIKVELPVLLEAIENQKRSEQWTKDNGQYIPNPTTWLNQGRWEDELPEKKGVGNAGTDNDKWAGLNITKLGGN